MHLADPDGLLRPAHEILRRSRRDVMSVGVMKEVDHGGIEKIRAMG